MAVINRELYNRSDINSYFTGCACMYDGVPQMVIDSSDDRLLLSSAGWVSFLDDLLTFPHPKPGCYQVGDSVHVLSKEPHRQWKKGFRLREAILIDTSPGLSSGRVEETHLMAALLLDREYSYAEAYAKVFDGDSVAHKINRSFYLRVGFNGRFIELYHRSSTAVPIGLAYPDRVVIYNGAELFREQIQQLGVEVNENNQ